MGIEVSIELHGAVGEYVQAMTDKGSWYASAEEYVRDLIRRDFERSAADFETFKSELQTAFAEPEENAIGMTADDFLARMNMRAP